MSNEAQAAREAAYDHYSASELTKALAAGEAGGDVAAALKSQVVVRLAVEAVSVAVLVCRRPPPH